jgi:hypothetical protein
MNLRKTIINNVKPKTINNHAMDGSTWTSLVAEYVKAINEGGIPNI